MSTIPPSFSDTQIIGVCTVGSSSTDLPGAVATQGVHILTASGGNVTAGKTVIATAYNTVEDGTTAGKVIGRALETFTSGNTGKILIQL